MRWSDADEPPRGTVFGDSSAGQHSGFCARQRCAEQPDWRACPGRTVSGCSSRGIPANSAFVLNRVDDFEASVADVVVGLGALNTRIVGAGAVQAFGTGTIIVRLPRPGERDDDHKNRDH